VAVLILGESTPSSEYSAAPTGLPSTYTMWIRAVESDVPSLARFPMNGRTGAVAAECDDVCLLLPDAYASDPCAHCSWVYSCNTGSGNSSFFVNPLVCRARIATPITNQMPPAILAGDPNPHQIAPQKRNPPKGNRTSERNFRE
jgi:hypothetical protein